MNPEDIRWGIEQFTSLIKVALWPAVAWYAIAQFKPQIAGILGRLKTISGLGLNVDASLAQQQLSHSKDVAQIDVKNVTLAEGKETSIDQVIQVPLIESKTELYPPTVTTTPPQQSDTAEPTKPNNAVEVLVEQLRTVLYNTQLALEFEKIYRVIYGSQLILLVKARQTWPLGLTDDELTPIFEYHVERTSQLAPLLQLSFQQWLSFLTENNLMVRAPDSKLYITQFGSTYLEYISAIPGALTSKAF